MNTHFEQPAYLLFDLDGTLLQWDGEAFLDEYMRTIAGAAEGLVDPRHFMKCLWASTQEMVKNRNPGVTNQQAFEDHFFQIVGAAKEDLWPLIDRFYAESFKHLSHHAKNTPLPRKVVETALQRGFKVVLATNPVFPKVAIMERMRWAGVHDLPFTLITAYEDFHFSKPHQEFYLEVTERIEAKPEQCVMIGNDMQEDMVASTVGMHTFWVKDQSNDRAEGPHYNPDESGSLEHLLDGIDKGRGIFQKL